MTRFVAILSLSIAFLTASFAVRADFVRGGGGLAEKNIDFAFVNLARFVNACLWNVSCDLTPAERTLLVEMLGDLPREQPPQFVSASRNKSLFQLAGGGPRLAVTEFVVGRPIYVNTDMLYQNDSPEGVKALSVPDAVAMLVHELGHHHGWRDHAALDILGSKVQTFAISVSQKIIYSRKQSQLSIQTYDSQSMVNLTQVLVSDGFELYDLGPQLRDALQCREGVLVGGHLDNVHFNLFEKSPESELNPHYVTAVADAQIFCGTEERKGLHSEDYFRVRFRMLVDNDEGGLYFLRLDEPIVVEFLDCSKDFEACSG